MPDTFVGLDRFAFRLSAVEWIDSVLKKGQIRVQRDKVNKFHVKYTTHLPNQLIYGPDVGKKPCLQGVRQS